LVPHGNSGRKQVLQQEVVPAEVSTHYIGISHRNVNIGSALKLNSAA
jgi:hypothetical protein